MSVPCYLPHFTLHHRLPDGTPAMGTQLTGRYRVEANALRRAEALAREYGQLVVVVRHQMVGGNNDVVATRTPPPPAPLYRAAHDTGDVELEAYAPTAKAAHALLKQAWTHYVARTGAENIRFSVVIGHDIENVQPYRVRAGQAFADATLLFE